MIAPDSARAATLLANPEWLRLALRGIEKEGLRVDAQARLAMTPHPKALGSALTNGRITTDYAEALLELITGTHSTVDAMLAELSDVHRFVSRKLGDELIWNQSMPANLPPEPDIAIGWYGTSNTGTLKHVYRRGLAERYGKAMQCIAGVHYNFSLPDTYWQGLGAPGAPLQDQRSEGYIALIRNFTRYSWLLMYLFGASPVVARRFMADKPASLEPLGTESAYLPYATSLRMSDLGYQNKAQSQLKLCYNSLDEFLHRMFTAVSQPWPDYEAIGTHRDGEWIQLNTNVLQIENEYYSIIRPKRTTGRCERPATALATRGVQYIEVRCLDIDPFEPIGISEATARFVDAFLLFCATEVSPTFGDAGFCAESDSNFARVVKQGRLPGLMLQRQGSEVSVPEWGTALLEQIRPYAEALDHAHGTHAYVDALAVQQAKLDDPALTPSARVLAGVRAHGDDFLAFTLAQSAAHAHNLRAAPMADETVEAFEQEALSSIDAQQRIEQSDSIDFDAYVRQYERALHQGCSPDAA